MGSNGDGKRPVSFSQDMIRRAADAIRAQWSGGIIDFHVLGHAALKGAFRNDRDVAQLHTTRSIPHPDGTEAT